MSRSSKQGSVKFEFQNVQMLNDSEKVKGRKKSIESKKKKSSFQQHKWNEMELDLQYHQSSYSFLYRINQEIMILHLFLMK